MLLNIENTYQSIWKGMLLHSSEFCHGSDLNMVWIYNKIRLIRKGFGAWGDCYDDGPCRLVFTGWSDESGVARHAEAVFYFHERGVSTEYSGSRSALTALLSYNMTPLNKLFQIDYFALYCTTFRWKCKLLSVVFLDFESCTLLRTFSSHTLVHKLE